MLISSHCLQQDQDSNCASGLSSSGNLGAVERCAKGNMSARSAASCFNSRRQATTFEVTKLEAVGSEFVNSSTNLVLQEIPRAMLLAFGRAATAGSKASQVSSFRPPFTASHILLVATGLYCELGHYESSHVNCRRDVLHPIVLQMPSQNMC
eukprot:c12182_g1_i1 orf=242-697(-)